MQGITHYENFPVASWLCPAALRPCIQAIYAFARCADDLADEGDAAAGQRLLALQQLRLDLHRVAQRALGYPADNCDGSSTAGSPQTDPTYPRWQRALRLLEPQLRRHSLPLMWLDRLLDAFEQDVHHSASGQRYADSAELLRYCACSANPIGRLLLHLYRIDDAAALRESDALCSALQLINFWQDLRQDLARQRYYLPLDALARFGVQERDLHPGCSQHPAAQAMMKELCQEARNLLLQGAPLARRLPGRIGWELRLVVSGGVRVLDKIEAARWRCWLVRPRLAWADAPALLQGAWSLPRAAQPLAL